VNSSVIAAAAHSYDTLASRRVSRAGADRYDHHEWFTYLDGTRDSMTNVCPEPGCPRLTPCPLHPNRRTMTTTQRGYGSSHQRLRKQLLPLAIGKLCPRCNQLMLMGQDLDLDHSDALINNPHSRADRIAHADCNRGAPISTPTPTRLAADPAPSRSLYESGVVSGW
jgi:hypothetical protein